MKIPHCRKFLVQISILSLLLAQAALTQGCASAEEREAAREAALKHYVISDYGAVADGTTLNTAAIQKVIDTATAAGGGVVEIPKGTFLSGSLFFKKDVELYLDEGAELLGSKNINDYAWQTTRIEGHFPEWRVALVNFTQMDRVRVGGKGQLNGNGAPFWASFRGAATNLAAPRPRLMFVDRCKDVLVEGVSLQDSGFWNLHLYDCSDVHIVGLSINAPRGAPSTDGIDVDSCQNVTISKCQISNSDDDIVLKGSKGPLADQDKDSPPVENILIEDCTIGDGNGLLTCGSEGTIVHNVLVRNCTITGNAKMLNLKLRPDTPQHYSNITFDGITLNGSGSMITSAPWTQYFDLAGQPAPRQRIVDHITIRNVTGNFGSFGSLRGNAANTTINTVADSISDFTVENVNVTLSNPAPLSRGEVANFTFKNVVVNGQPVEAPPATAPAQGRGRAAPRGTPAAANASTAPGTPATAATPLRGRAGAPVAPSATASP